MSSACRAPISEDFPPPARLPRATMIGWGLGSLPPVIVFSATNALLLRFMTDQFGLGPGLAAGLIAASKIYDAVADPTMGIISDRTRTRWGRRRPYLIVGAILLALVLVALFAPPALASARARALYMAAMLFAYATAYSLFNIPYMAMPAEMTESYHLRSELMSYRVAAVGIAILLASSGGPALIAAAGGGRHGHAVMALALAPIVAAGGLVAAIATRHAPCTQRPAIRLRLRDGVASLLANRPFLVLLGVKFLTLATLGAQAVYPFFFTRILGVTYRMLGLYFLCNAVAMIASQPLWLALSRRAGKRPVLLLALAASIPVWASWYAAGPGDPAPLFWLRALLQGVTAGGVLLMGQSMLPDTIEFDHLTTGLRREGLLAGLYTTMEKVSGAAGIAAVGAGLAAAGYIPSSGATVAQPASALQAIRLLISLLPAALCLAALLLLLLYRLDAPALVRLRAARACAPVHAL